MAKGRERGTTKNVNLDIDSLLMVKPMLLEIEELRRQDVEEQKAVLGSQRLDGMPHGSSHNSDLGDVVSRAEALHQRRMQQIDAYTAMIDAAEVILRKIPVKQRTIARLLYVNQLPMWRIANIVGLSEITVKRMKADMESKTRF